MYTVSFGVHEIILLHDSGRVVFKTTAKVCVRLENSGISRLKWGKDL